MWSCVVRGTSVIGEYQTFHFFPKMSKIGVQVVCLLDVFIFHTVCLAKIALMDLPAQELPK